MRSEAEVEFEPTTSDMSRMLGVDLTAPDGCGLLTLDRPSVQLVDCRFNRRRHEATRIIEAFGAHLRDQVTSTP